MSIACETSPPCALPRGQHVPIEGDAGARARALDTRQALLLAALMQFSECGFSRASTRKIAQAAGANIGSIAYYFGDKAGLYRAMFRELPQQFGKALMSAEAFACLETLPIEQVLDVYYQEFTDSCFGEEYDRAAVKMWFREMLEPTGEGQNYLDTQVTPKHRFLQTRVARSLDCPLEHESAQAVTQFVVSLGTHLMTCEEIWRRHSAQLIESESSRKGLRARMVQAAMAMIDAERRRMDEERARN